MNIYNTSIVLSLIFILIILYLIKKRKIEFNYSLFWFSISIIIFVLAINRNLFERISNFFGIDYAPALLFIGGILFNNEKIKLLGCDVNDNIYVQSMTQKNNFYVLNNNKIMNTIKLKDCDYTKILYNGSAIYVVYRNYVINLVNDTNKKITYDKNTSFMNIVDKRIYVRNNNEIKTEEISGNS